MVLAIQQDAPTDTLRASLGDEPGDLFLKAILDAEKPSGAEDEDKKAKPPTDDKPATDEETPAETDETEAEGEDDQDTDEDTDKEEDEGKRKRVVLEPDAEAYVKHKVDGKEVEIPVKDLARLYGQEAALTRKSQETAEVRKQVDDQGARYTAGLEAMLARALERAKPYADINFLALAKDPTYTAEDLQSLQAAAQAAVADVEFLHTQLDETVKEAQHARQTNLVKAAAEAWKTLSDPDKGIPGWDEKMYNDIRSYAIGGGIPAQTVNELVDPVAIKILHKAMLYDKGQSASVKTVKVDKEPKRIIKSSSDATVAKSKGKASMAPLARLAQTGDVEDAQAYFLAQMTDK